MPLQMSAVMLGVGDLARSKKFYAEGLGCAIEKDFPKFVSLSLGDGAPYLAIYEREAAAEDAGVSAEGSGFTGISFHYTVGSHEAVDEVMSSAVAAGARGCAGSRRRAVGRVFRVLQRPGWLSVEGRLPVLRDLIMIRQGSPGQRP